ncbi:serine/threonine protein kinase [Pseudogymnoascus destructans 20631-21]|uniref:Serine/threonine protein kinase n=1 Tax=Pseudogymnoascus destructans (strain ATCC MYA-4855 / 20631-21) TaxID=658429 RepID=L8G8N6_PSED2|nr:serine/threonine protein kinase [Pseudogymnoascus destructans 20631-21]
MAKFLPFQDATTQMLLPHETLDTDHRSVWPWKRWFAREEPLTPRPDEQAAAAPRPNLARRISRKAIPGLPRPGTFKRRQSELRHNLEAAKAKQNERRAFSVDPHSADQLCDSPKTSTLSLPRNSAPTLIGVATDDADITTEEQQAIPELAEPEILRDDFAEHPGPHSIAGSDELLDEELDKRWILNLSMHFRDRSNREKFFVTYAETPTHWRRVTISLDYREAPLGSLEEELQKTQYQRDKSARIYLAIRESLPDIQFYDTVTNLKLQTESDRLHVHVTEDIHEVIQFPPVSAINHLYCQRVKEQDLVFDSHLSGFVYKVTVNGRVFIKKEIPGPDTVEEFLYEVNALHRLSGSDSVIQFGGVITSNDGSQLKGLLISFAEKGALIDVIYDGKDQLSWPRRECWAKQIVQGLSEIHEAGFVQGDFTLSNIVIDGEDNAKIIDINRRGCPVGWEPPEVAALIDSKQRISMYIGVKSDIFQLGMVLWALAMQQDEPEIQPRPLTLASAPQEIPSYYRALVGICLSDDPRTRCHTTSLLSLFPEIESDDHGRDYGNQPSDRAESQYIDPANAVERDDIDNFRLMDSQTSERGGMAPSTGTHTRGRSPPRSAVEEHEYEPRIVTVSPGRHYLEEYQVNESVPDNVVDDFVVPHDIADNDAIGGGEATVHFDIEDVVGDNEHTNSGENRHAIDHTENSPEDMSHIDNAAEDVTSSPAHEIVVTKDITTAIANENASIINGDAIEASAISLRDESQDVLGSLRNATESNTAVSRNHQNIQILAATVAHEDTDNKERDVIESYVATPDNGGEITLNSAATVMSYSGHAQSATEDNSTVAGYRSDDIEIMSGDVSYITGNMAEDRDVAPGDGIEETQNVVVKHADWDANDTAEDKIKDDTVLGGSSNSTGDKITGNGIASEEAVGQSAIPGDEEKECGEVATEEFVILGLRTNTGTSLQHQDNNLEQMDAAIGDLTGIGGHSTLEHSQIPQGISDDDLMTDMR